MQFDKEIIFVLIRQFVKNSYDDKEEVVLQLLLCCVFYLQPLSPFPQSENTDGKSRGQQFLRNLLILYILLPEFCVTFLVSLCAL